jgi:hypothetical protein
MTTTSTITKVIFTMQGPLTDRWIASGESGPSGATAVPSQADTCTLRIVFGKAGLLAAIGSGEGVLTFHGKHYPFIVAGASVGATIGVSASVLRGAAHFISSPGDLAGTYTGVGGGAAVAAGISAVKLRNEKGVVLELRGAKLGVEVSANLPLVTITMK